MLVKQAFYQEVLISDIDDVELNNIKKFLTSRSKDYMSGEIVEVQYYHIDEQRKTIQVPRFYPLANVSSIIDISEKGASLSEGYSFNSNFKYRSGQEESVDKSLTQDIITLMKPPGSGKTLIGSCSIFKRGVRSLIIVDQDNLRAQWLDALQLVFAGSIEVAKDLKLDGTEKDMGKDVYVTTIQSIISKIRINGLEYVRDMYTKYQIGNVLLDECHVLIGPEKFSLFGHICNSKYILALSATPKDDIYFQYWLGTTVVGDSNYEVTPYIVLIDYQTDLNKSRKFIKWAGKFRRDRYSQKLFGNDSFLHYICSLAYKAYLLKRNVLIMCDFNKYGVNIVMEYLLKYVDQDKFGAYISGCKKKEVSVKPIIVSNYKMLQKGTDIPTLDTLIMANDVSNVTALEQTIGRLLRLNKGIIKKDLLCFDIKDTSFGEMFHRRRKIRKEFYEEKEFYIIE